MDKLPQTKPRTIALAEAVIAEESTLISLAAQRGATLSGSDCPVEAKPKLSYWLFKMHNGVGIRRTAGIPLDLSTGFCAAAPETPVPSASDHDKDGGWGREKRFKANRGSP
jgi:hypothetical protein